MPDHNHLDTLNRDERFRVEQACAILVVRKSLIHQLRQGEKVVLPVLYVRADECGYREVATHPDNPDNIALPKPGELSGSAAAVYKLLSGSGEKPFIELQPYPGQDEDGIKAVAVCIALKA
jgi:hypothetical protein